MDRCVALMGEKTMACSVPTGNPEVKRLSDRWDMARRITILWMFENMVEGVDWIQVAQDRDETTAPCTRAHSGLPAPLSRGGLSRPRMCRIQRCVSASLLPARYRHGRRGSTHSNTPNANWRDLEQRGHYHGREKHDQCGPTASSPASYWGGPESGCPDRHLSWFTSGPK
jgi:hypothetical protein